MIFKKKTVREALKRKRIPYRDALPVPHCSVHLGKSETSVKSKKNCFWHFALAVFFQIIIAKFKTLCYNDFTFFKYAFIQKHFSKNKS